jgi:hypothetical protein
MRLIDASERTTKIPAIPTGGKLINQITRLPVVEIADDAPCEITVRTNRVTDLALVEVLADKTEIVLLPSDTVLLAQVNCEHTPQDLKKLATRPSGLSANTPGHFVEIQIKTELKMQFRGSKSPQLRPCICFIPSTNETGTSINHAYSLISIAFEPKRRAHTGNVFEKVFYKHNFGSRHEWWRELGELRSEKLTEYGQYLAQMYGDLKQERKRNLF